MDARHFQRIEALFQAALERGDGERERFLVETEPDADVRAAVERLLARHFAGDETLRGAVAAAVQAPAHGFRQIGPYRVLRELGSGGMGTVLLAERTFGATSQKVALKLIRGFPTAKAREHLLRERNLLAGLNHPNIAGLLDAGETDDHVPYLVMEYVDGVPLHRYCDEQGLDVRARLRLFAQLCRAVQHAHQRLVVHRDIKPGNILVRDDGTPVLLDFGIGKLLDATDRDATATHVFTPAYAAPEQLAGRNVTTAADVWGLGCVLHELLSGRRINEVNVGGRVPAPSAAALETGRARALRGELDTLVGKAMHAEPERRYASAQAFADDVENYLRGKPLLAAPDSVFYRTRKFVARHRVAAVASLVVVALAGVFVWRLAAERTRAQAAENRAEREAISTKRSRDFLVSLFAAASPERGIGKGLSARELIDQGNRDLGHELRDEPETAAQLGLTIAQVYAAFGDPAATIAAAQRALASTRADDAATALLRAEILLTLGRQYDNTERYADGRQAIDEALALRRRFAPDDHAAIAEALSESAASAERRGDHAAARAAYDHAGAELARSDKPDSKQRAELLRGLSEVDNAEGHLADSLRHAHEAVGALADQPPGSPLRIDYWRAQATAQVANGDPGGALATLEHALDVAHAAIGETSYTVADVENDIAVALNGQGRYRDAIPHLEKSIHVTEALRPGAHVATAFSQVNLGSLYENLGDYEKAERYMRDGVAALEAEAPDTPELDNFRCNLARTLMKRGRYAESRALFDRALRNIAAREGADSFNYAYQSFRLAKLDFTSGRLEAAETGLRDTERVLAPLLPPHHALRVQFAVVSGQIAWRRGDLAAAQQAFETAQAEQEALHGTDPIDLAIIRMRLGAVLVARGDVARGRRLLEPALQLIEATLLPQSVEIAEARGYREELARYEATR